MTGTALLVMDVQNGIVERFAAGTPPLLDPLGRAIAGARAAGVPVVYVRVAFRPGTPEISRAQQGLLRRRGLRRDAHRRPVDRGPRRGRARAG